MDARTLVVRVLVIAFLAHVVDAFHEELRAAEFPAHSCGSGRGHGSGIQRAHRFWPRGGHHPRRHHRRGSGAAPRDLEIEGEAPVDLAHRRQRAAAAARRFSQKARASEPFTRSAVRVIECVPRRSGHGELKEGQVRTGRAFAIRYRTGDRRRCHPVDGLLHAPHAEKAGIESVIVLRVRGDRV